MRRSGDKRVSIDQGTQQPEPEQYPDDTQHDLATNKGAYAGIDKKQAKNDRGDAEPVAVDAEGTGKAVDEVGAGVDSRLLVEEDVRPSTSFSDLLCGCIFKWGFALDQNKKLFLRYSEQFL